MVVATRLGRRDFARKGSGVKWGGELTTTIDSGTFLVINLVARMRPDKQELQRIGPWDH